MTRTGHSIVNIGADISKLQPTSRMFRPNSEVRRNLCNTGSSAGAAIVVQG